MNTVKRTMEPQAHFREIYYDAQMSLLYVAAYKKNAIYAFDLDLNKNDLETIAISGSPYSIVMNGGKMYVGVSEKDSNCKVLVIQNKTVVTSIDIIEISSVITSIFIDNFGYMSLAGESTNSFLLYFIDIFGTPKVLSLDTPNATFSSFDSSNRLILIGKNSINILGL
jgi:hypothetical protein